MSGPKASPNRRRGSLSKGDRRELAILDAAERQLATDGLDGMTVETIATAAGITRGALYFYFGSRNDVLAALVERTAAALVYEVEHASSSGPGDPREALREGVTHTARSWSERGAVMRAAVELSPSVPEIDASWQSAIAATAIATQGVMMRAGVADDDGPTGAAAISKALVAMTERCFYRASKQGTSLDEVARTLTHVWLAVLPDQ